MADANLITVILTTSGNVNRACVESVLAQTVSDLELLIVGSTVEGLNDPRIKFIPSDKNLNSARNVGLEHAVGTFVYFIDGDGMILDNALEVLINAAAESGAEVVQSTTLIERDGEDLSVVGDQKMLSLNLYRRDFLERANLKFPESSEDAEPFCYAAECMAPTVAFIDDYFYVVDRQKKFRADSAEYVKDIYRDEIRDGFLVTSQRKKLWNAQIKLIIEFARVCRKYNLKWFAYGGTLLGAVRHGGYIPWDDDIDLGMLRPDYERFIEVAPRELKSDYFLDVWYNYALEGEANPEHLPVVSNELAQNIRERGWWWPIIADFIKLRSNNTAMIQWPERRNVHQGIWIDIIPLDPVPPFDNEQDQINFEITKELMMTVSFPDVISKALENGEPLRGSTDVLKEMLSLPYKERAMRYTRYLRQNFFESPHVSRQNNVFLRNPTYWWKTSYLREPVELPFELIKLPAPIDYEDFLTARYGNWRELVFNYSHVTAYTVDMSYREYFEKVSPGIKVHMF